ncbi:monocyte chemotactic protein 1B-like [Scomber scombrus]|uniref:Monocyte chemotactic protein 1B-like n=1 Tax=Scomber scombrus TaxID=13677 RepID=A0AAV1PDR0_SCOSC
MAPWGDGKLLFCVLFLTCCIATLAQIPVDRNFKKKKEMEKHVVVDYRRQVKGQSCSVGSAFFVTRHGKTLCSAANLLNGVMKRVDDVKKLCKQNNYMHKLCFGVKPDLTALLQRVKEKVYPTNYHTNNTNLLFHTKAILIFLLSVLYSIV